MSRAALASCTAAGCLGAAAAALGHLGGSCGAWAPAASRPWPHWACRAACVCAMLAANGAMLTLYVRSLRALPSLQATVLSNAANIAFTVRRGQRGGAGARCARELHACTCTAVQRAWLAQSNTTLAPPPPPPRPTARMLQGVLGRMLFGERLTARWLLGVTTVICGLGLISLSAVQEAAAAAASGQLAAPRPAAAAAADQSGGAAPVAGSAPQRQTRSRARAAAGSKAE
jgi:hypothetical protein